MKKLEQIRQESKEIKDKIDNTEERLRQLKNQEKNISKQDIEKRRKERTHRIITRGAILESLIENADLEKENKEVHDKITTEKIDLSKIKVEPLFEDFVDFDTFSKSDFRVVKVKNCEEVPKSKKLLKFTLDDGSGKERIILSGIKNFYNAEELVGKTLLAITNLPPRQMMGLESCGMLLSPVCEYEGEELLNLIMLDSKIPAGAKIY